MQTLTRRKKTEKSPKRSQEDNDHSGYSDDTDGESCAENNPHTSQKDAYSPQMKKGHSDKKEKEAKVEEEREENMDIEYIKATVARNGGPCKTQQDVDKMMLRFDGKSRTEKREAMRCEILYQKMVLNNTDPNLYCTFHNSTQMVLKLKLALPRVKPGYSLVWAPKKTKTKATTGWSEHSST